MASSASDLLRIELQQEGDNPNDWGDVANAIFERIEDAIAGAATITTASGAVTLTASDYVEDQARMAALVFNATLTDDLVVTVPSSTKHYIVHNTTSGAYSVTIKPSGGTGVVVPQGTIAWVWCDGSEAYFAGPPVTPGTGESLTGVQASAFNANTILKADSDDTPVALTVAEQTLVGRITSGSIAALTAAQARTLLNVEDGAEANDVDSVAGLTGAVAAGDLRNALNVEDGAQANTVDSVNTKTGVVVIDPDDLDDTATTNKFTNATDISKLAGIEDGAEVNTVNSVNGATGVVVLDADDIDDASTAHKFATADELATIGKATTLPEILVTDDYTMLATDRGKVITFNKATAVTYALLPVATAGAGYQVKVKNVGAGTLTIDGDGSEEVDGATTYDLPTGGFVTLWCTGTEWRVGGGGVALDTFSFDQAQTGFFFEPDGARIHRMADRLMVGEAAAYTGGQSPGATGSWLFDQGAGSSTLEWLEINGRTVSVTSRGIGVVGAARNDDGIVGVGVAGIGVNNGSDADGKSWGFYGEGVLNNASGRAKGAELNAIALVDAHTDFTPYGDPAKTLALWLVSGGDPVVNPTTYAADAALGIGTNGNVFDAGIVIANGALTRDGGATGRAHAVRMAYDHAVEWYEYTTGALALSLVSQITAATYKQELRVGDTGLALLNTAGKTMLKADWVASSVNYPALVPGAAGSSVDLFARGDDTNIALRIGGKGSGFVTMISNVNLNNTVLARNGVQVVSSRKTGWALATGTATRTTFDTTTVTTAQLAERVKALIDDLHGTAGHGLIGT